LAFFQAGEVRVVAYGVAAVDDVIDRPFKLKTKLTCHGSDSNNLSSRGFELQNSGPDPVMADSSSGYARVEPIRNNQQHVVTRPKE
jgi:hypothetical protein